MFVFHYDFYRILAVKIKNEALSKVIYLVNLNLFQDPNELYIRSRNKFGMTRFTIVLTFESASKYKMNFKRFRFLWRN